MRITIVQATDSVDTDCPQSWREHVPKSEGNLSVGTDHEGCGVASLKRPRWAWDVPISSCCLLEGREVAATHSIAPDGHYRRLYGQTMELLDQNCL